MKNSIVVAFLLCSSSLISPAFSVLDSDEVVDLSAPFATKGKFHLSPIEGVDLSLMKGLRFHGRYSAKKSSFPAVEHNQLSPDDLPQDAVASIIQRLFPSPAHDTLAANNLIHDHVRKWLTPASTARLLSFIEDHNHYISLSDEERLIGIMEAISSHFQDKLKALQKQRGINLDDKKHLLQKYTNQDIYVFAALLNRAILTSRDPNHPNGKFYPPRVIERALLVYMDLQAPGKKALQPYYDAMAGDLVDKAFSPNLTSKKTKEDYFTLKSDLNSGKVSLEEFLKNPEQMLFLHLGFTLYEDGLPPKANYCMVSYKDPDGEIFKFSNCGEATLLCALNAGLFNRVTRGFDISHLAKLKDQGLISPHEGLFSFFKNIQNTTSKVGNFLTPDHFAQLIANLNTPDTKDPICYRKAKGTVQEKEKNGIYEIDSGVDNFLRVIGRLLGDPQWASMQGKKDEIAQSVVHNLNRFCKLFTRENFKLSWQNAETEDQSIKNLRETNLTFSINDTEEFKLEFGPGYFDFYRVSKKNTEDFVEIGKQILKLEKPWHPFFAFYIENFKALFKHEFSSPEVLASYLKGYFYSSSLESLESRRKALKAMVRYKRDFKSDIFDYLLSRWLTPEGKYFDEWRDHPTNLKILNTLSSIMSFNYILDLGIQPFATLLSHDNLTSTFEAAVDNDLSDLGRLLLSQKGALQSLVHQTFTYPDSDDEDESDEEDSEEGSDSESSRFHEESEEDSVEEYYNGRASYSLLHGLASLNLPGFMEEAVRLGGDVNKTNERKDTPLHYAMRDGNVESTQKLLELGADPNIQNSWGETYTKTIYVDYRSKLD